MTTRDEMLAALAASLDVPPEVASGEVGAGSGHYASWLPDDLEKPHLHTNLTTRETNMHDALKAAATIAPVPYEEGSATREAWLRHYVAQAIAAHTAFRDALPALSDEVTPGDRPDLGYLITIAVASTAAAVALCSPVDEVAAQLWSLTPEAGALNGEYEDWLIDRAVELGINPADLNHYLDPEDFRSPQVVTG